MLACCVKRTPNRPVVVTLLDIPMRYKGVAYVVRTSIVRDKWNVAIYINENAPMPIERTVKGSKLKAEAAVKTMIDRLLKPSARDKGAKRG